MKLVDDGVDRLIGELADEAGLPVVERPSWEAIVEHGVHGREGHRTYGVDRRVPELTERSQIGFGLFERAGVAADHRPDLHARTVGGVEHSTEDDQLIGEAG